MFIANKHDYLEAVHSQRSKHLRYTLDEQGLRTNKRHPQTLKDLWGFCVSQPHPPTLNASEGCLADPSFTILESK